MTRSWMNYNSDTDTKDLRVLLIYANSPMDNLMPISISSVAGALRRKGFQIRLFDTTFYRWTSMGGGERKDTLQVPPFSYDEVGIKYADSDVFDDFYALIKEYQPHLIGLSTVEPTHEFGLQLLSRIAEFNIPTIVGGVHTIFSPEDVINEPFVDMICLGEGEKSMVELCERLSKKQDHTSIDNIWVKDGGKIFKNKKASLIDMDELPELDFSIFDENRFYRPMAGKMYRMVPIEFSRGCIYKCSYCSAPAFAEIFRAQGKWFRNKSIDKIMAEIKTYIKTYNVEYFYFVSETFLAMPNERFSKFCRQYSKMGIPFWFNTRPETITVEKIKMLEDIGCHRMSVGIECGNETYRRTMLHRAVSNDTIVKACEIVAKSKIQLSVNNIIGFPDETRDMMFDTIFLNRKIEADSYSCSIFQPYRGTFLHKYCVEKGYIDYSKLAIDLTVTSILKQSFIAPDEIKGLARTFPLYIKMPENDFTTIRKAEELTPEGDAIWKTLRDEVAEKHFRFDDKRDQGSSTT